MYFLTNKEDYIVAASSDFLTAIGSREICSISAMLQNQLITLDELNNRLNIPNKDLEYSYNLSTMHSAFGNLKLFTLSTPISDEKTEEDENIAYLKKLQDGTVEQKDNEYAIPDIPTLHKEVKEEVKLPTADKVEIEPNKEVKIPEIPKEAISKTEEIELPTTEKSEKKQEPTLENEELEVKIPEVPKVESANDELINSLKDIEIKTAEQTEIAIPEDKSIDKLADEIIKTKESKDTTEVEEILKEKEEKVLETFDNTEITDSVSINNHKDTIEEEQSTTNKKQKESGLRRITKKLFPWGNKKNQEIELEDDTTYELDLKSATKLEQASKDTKEMLNDTQEIISDEIKTIDIDKEGIQEELKAQKTEDIANDVTEKIEESINIPDIPALKADEVIESPQTEEITNKVVEDTKENINIPDIPVIKAEEVKETIETPKTEEIANKVVEDIKENINIPDIPIVKEEVTPKATEDNKEVEQIKLDNTTPTVETSDKKEKITNIEPTKPSISAEDTTDTNNELSTLKEQIARIETTEDKQQAPKEDDVKAKEKDNKIIYKLINLQVEGIDFEKNANKLSIDTSSYKMLLNNYLDEIEKYNNELENGVSSTINMLKDAGELLSLDILTKKLEHLKSNNNKKDTLKEISLIASLLKEKADKKLTKTDEVKTIEIPETIKTKVKNVESTEDEFKKAQPEEVISIPEIPDEIIDITSAQELLASINQQSVSFNPNRAAEELNLPKTLILEFVEDFISQAKEHLPLIVEAYKKEDIKTIQTTAHMLKGAASNLRLDTIAENLFKIQKESSISNSGELIKQFVAKLKGLSSEVASLEDAEDEN